MSRSLTPAERNKVKNLQVSNSIYKKDIRNLNADIEALKVELAEVTAKEVDLLGEAAKTALDQIIQIKSSIVSKEGLVAYKEGKIASKEVEVEDIKTTAMREEDEGTDHYDPNSPENIAKKNAIAAKREANIEAKRANGRRVKKDTVVQPTTTEF